MMDGTSRVRWHAAHRALAVVLAAGLTLAGTRTGLAQSTAPTPQQLDTLVAPIALYPDALVAHILPASTYPVEIVEAARDLQNGGKPSAADMNAWDPSIQALVSVPSVITMMNDRLSWTTELGQAVSQNQQAVMDAIQRVRDKAKQAGNLTSNAQQTVSTQGDTIVIAPTNPQVIYVPQYDPVAILQPAPLWATPGYGLLTFGAGFAAGYFTAYACHWGGGWGWGGGGSITVNNNYHWNHTTNVNNVNVNNARYSSWNAPKNVGHITNTYPGANRPVDQGKLGGDGGRWGDDGFGGHDDGFGKGGGFGDGGAKRDDGFGGGHGGGFGDDGFRGMGGDGWGARDASDRGARSFGGDGFGGDGFGGGGFGRGGGFGGGGWGGGGHGGGFGGFGGGGRGRR
ncbi:MAG: DUF3300 domain-containing protein [bacterium]|nr:DUF3300 domain-containing protein [bacterium]